MFYFSFKTYVLTGNISLGILCSKVHLSSKLAKLVNILLKALSERVTEESISSKMLVDDLVMLSLITTIP